MLKIRRILVPVDFSEHAARALEHARAIAASHDAALELLHVIEEPAFPAFYGAAYKAAYGAVPDVQEEARAALERLTQAVRETDVERGIGHYVRRGHAATEIIQLAEEHDIDLIVIASHGLTSLEHLLLGSVAEKVVRTASCPVFVVKAFGKSLVEPVSAAEEETAS